MQRSCNGPAPTFSRSGVRSVRGLLALLGRGSRGARADCRHVAWETVKPPPRKGGLIGDVSRPVLHTLSHARSPDVVRSDQPFVPRSGRTAERISCTGRSLLASTRAPRKRGVAHPQQPEGHGMSTAKPAGFEHWTERDIEDLVANFELAFDRSPSSYDLRNFRRARSAAVRLPLQARRTIATMITSD